MTIKAHMAFDVDGDGYTMIVTGVGVDGRARLDGSSSDDEIVVSECEISSDLSVNFGDGFDEVTLDNNRMGRNLTTDGGHGFDVLNHARLLIGGRNSSRRFEITTDVG